MPRSLPVITGLPWSLGSRACSQEAKKASPSIWTMARGKEWSVNGMSSFIAVFADDGNNYSNDLELLFGVEGFVALVGRFQVHRAAALAEIFHGIGVVDLRDDDIAVAGLQAALGQ